MNIVPSVKSGLFYISATFLLSNVHCLFKKTIKKALIAYSLLKTSQAYFPDLHLLQSFNLSFFSAKQALFYFVFIYD